MKTEIDVTCQNDDWVYQSGISSKKNRRSNYTVDINRNLDSKHSKLDFKQQKIELWNKPQKTKTLTTKKWDSLMKAKTMSLKWNRNGGFSQQDGSGFQSVPSWDLTSQDWWFHYPRSWIGRGCNITTESRLVATSPGCHPKWAKNKPFEATQQLVIAVPIQGEREVFRLHQQWDIHHQAHIVNMRRQVRNWSSSGALWVRKYHIDHQHWARRKTSCDQ